MTAQRAMQAERPDQYERLGITKEVSPFEDGLRTDPHHKGTFEWWYFDATLSDGAKLVVVFYTKNATAPNVGLEPTVSIDLDLPDGRTIHKRCKLPPPSSTRRRSGATCESATIVLPATCTPIRYRRPSRMCAST